MPRLITTLALAALAAVVSWLAPPLPALSAQHVIPPVVTTPPGAPPVTQDTDWVLLLDTSGSMSDRSTLSYAKLAIRRLDAQRPPNTGLAVFTYSDRTTQILAADTPRTDAQLADLLYDVHDGGGSNLYDALSTVLREASGARVVVLSDGTVNAGIVDTERLVALASAIQDAGGRVSTVSLNPDGAMLMQRIARSGGGSHTALEHPRDLPKLTLTERFEPELWRRP